MCHSHTTKCHSALKMNGILRRSPLWMNLSDIRPSGREQTPKDRYCTTDSLTWGTQNAWVCRDGRRWGRGGGVLFKGAGVSLWKDAGVREADGGEGCPTLGGTQCHQLANLKTTTVIRFVSGVFHHDKKEGDKLLINSRQEFPRTLQPRPLATAHKTARNQDAGAGTAPGPPPISHRPPQPHVDPFAWRLHFSMIEDNQKTNIV